MQMRKRIRHRPFRYGRSFAAPAIASARARADRLNDWRAEAEKALREAAAEHANMSVSIPEQIDAYPS
jgi:hypothetical protein